MLAAHPVMALIHKKGKSWSKLLLTSFFLLFFFPPVFLGLGNKQLLCLIQECSLGITDCHIPPQWLFERIIPDTFLKFPGCGFSHNAAADPSPDHFQNGSWIGRVKQDLRYQLPGSEKFIQHRPHGGLLSQQDHGTPFQRLKRKTGPLFTFCLLGTFKFPTFRNSN